MLIEAQERGDRGTALPKRAVGARWEWVANATLRYTPGKQTQYEVVLVSP
jgi:urease beta subunit